MAAILILAMIALCSGRGVQSLLEFPGMSYDEEDSDGGSIGLSLDGPSLDMESLASHAEGALAALTDSMGMSLSKPKKKIKTNAGSGTSPPQNRPAVWTSPRVEVKPASLKQTPCSHFSADQHLNAHQLLISPKVDPNKASVPLIPVLSQVGISTNNQIANQVILPSNVDIATQPQYVEFPTKSDISTSHQYVNLPPKVDVSTINKYVKLPFKVGVATNHQYVHLPSDVGITSNTSLPTKELSKSGTSNVLVGSYLIPGYSHQHSVYAVKENNEDLASLGASYHHLISSLYKQPQGFSHTSNSSPVLPSFPAFGASSTVNPPQPHVPIASTTETMSSFSPKGDLGITNGFVVPPLPLSHMIYTDRNHSEIPLSERQVKQIPYYHQPMPPYTYYPSGSFCHHSKSNLPPLSGSVLPRPFMVNYQPLDDLPSSDPYYGSTSPADTNVYVPQLQQPQQEYYNPQNEVSHHLLQ